jgi:Protein of unknown function (DUF1420)
VVLATGMIAARSSGRLRSAIVIASVAILLLPMQVWMRNFIFYGDPISPFLERFKAVADPDVVDFAGFLRACCQEEGIARFLLLPARMIGFVHFGEITTALGLGTLAFLFALGSGANRVLLRAALVTTVLELALSQVTPRFFLEPYLWCAAAAVGQRNRLKPLLHGALAAQCALVAIAALFGAFVLVPGIFTPHGRLFVMSNVAKGYDDARWLNTVLPRDAFVVTTLRSHALLERPFVAADDTLELSRALRRDEPQFAILARPSDEPPPVLTRCLGARFAGPKEFRDVTRNPLNRGAPYQVEVFQLDLQAHSCR